ncbi:Coiled-coil domain-containing protein 25 [Coemansia aciculifera]|uniref:Coiled-coil domain-containing protein 25 n=2 Tax=Coemansia TaxID=4863 RepID=A0A9W8GYJ1_9FUNG|nr:Coiled-coil domain-containing protein 25 [Coemansia pectinata]KAJ2864431.1 Coiled-coil domain-containing protein 25 [Coemansia aciculifera]KAJ2870174.1 Coiled-coil domain-containing protein 25 [Coemansia aciculifera]
MVLYFTSNVVDPPATIYMGKDKFENEDLIKHGWPEDVWFHADKLSSAHVYLRLAPGQSWETIPTLLLDDLAQLCKANSIEGNKKDNINIVYTPWSNLFKRGDMAPGQVTYKNPKLVKRVHVAERQNAIVNRLNKTKRITYPDLYQMRAERDREEKREKTMAANKQKAEERRAAEEDRLMREDTDLSKMFANVAAAGKKKKGGKNKPTNNNLFGESSSDEEDVPGRRNQDIDDFF